MRSRHTLIKSTKEAKESISQSLSFGPELPFPTFFTVQICDKYSPCEFGKLLALRRTSSRELYGTERVTEVSLKMEDKTVGVRETGCATVKSEITLSWTTEISALCSDVGNTSVIKAKCDAT
jgi:hypothetical protein